MEMGIVDLTLVQYEWSLYKKVLPTTGLVRVPTGFEDVADRNTEMTTRTATTRIGQLG